MNTACLYIPRAPMSYRDRKHRQPLAQALPRLVLVLVHAHPARLRVEVDDAQVGTDGCERIEAAQLNRRLLDELGELVWDLESYGLNSYGLYS